MAPPLGRLGNPPALRAEGWIPVSLCAPARLPLPYPPYSSSSSPLAAADPPPNPFKRFASRIAWSRDAALEGLAAELSEAYAEGGVRVLGGLAALS